MHSINNLYYSKKRGFTLKMSLVNVKKFERNVYIARFWLENISTSEFDFIIIHKNLNSLL